MSRVGAELKAMAFDAKALVFYLIEIAKSLVGKGRFVVIGYDPENLAGMRWRAVAGSLPFNASVHGDFSKLGDAEAFAAYRNSDDEVNVDATGSLYYVGTKRGMRPAFN